MVIFNTKCSVNKFYLGPTIKSYSLLNWRQLNGIIRTEYVHMEMVKTTIRTEYGYRRNTDTDGIRTHGNVALSLNVKTEAYYDGLFSIARPGYIRF